MGPWANARRERGAGTCGVLYDSVNIIRSEGAKRRDIIAPFDEHISITRSNMS
jgi:hypothetical protein